MFNEIINEIGSPKKMTEKEFFKCLNDYLKGGKLDNAIDKFWNYRENIKNEIQQKYPNLVKQLAFYFLLLQDINTFIKEAYETNKNKDTVKYMINVCSKLFNKSLQTFIDIFGLMECGSVMNTFVLWRTIYENYVIAKYIMENTEEEAKLFNEYDVIQSYKLLKIKITPEQKEKFIKKYGKDYNNDYSWAVGIKGKITFLKIVRKAKEKKYYKFYQLASYIGHSSSFSVNKGIILQDKNANTNMIGFYTDELTTSLNAIISVMCEFANIMINQFVDKKNKDLLERLSGYYGNKIINNWKQK